MSANRMQRGTTALLVVDIQEKMMPHIADGQAVIGRSFVAATGFNQLDLPVLVTEQYRKGLGETVEALATELAGASLTVEKMAFSACVDDVKQKLIAINARQVLVVGVETHVCVLQTCMDLMDMGLTAYLAVDACGSRRPLDHEVALSRLNQAGVVLTTVESALLELVGSASEADFKALLPIIKPL